ncbi:HypA protein [Nemania sp. FL0031]|nr:HypA protein [Nemania sp. FL0031]
MINVSRLPLRPLTRGTSTTSTTITKYILGRHLSIMATARTIQIAPENTGLWHLKQTEAAAKKTTELLQVDLEKHHCFFNKQGFHNHISHHLLSLYGIGASPADIQQGYDDNANYQRTPYQVHPDKVEELRDFEKAKAKLGKEEYYTDFLAFFQKEIDEKGWQAVLSEHLFKGDERSEDMLIRMFAGFLHPIIQLMYGIEWQQPAIVAMGLAQAAVHEDNMRTFLVAAEEAASSASAPPPMGEISDLFRDVAGDEKLATSARLSDGNKVRDGVLTRAFDEAVRVASRVRVAPADLERRTVEMYNTSVYEATGAAIRPGKEVRYDFFLMHHVNVCPLFVAINEQDWIPQATKVRLLEWKIRFDLLQYAARACAPVSLEQITSYVPKAETLKPTAELLPRIFALHDDGHVSKLIRAVGLCESLSKPYEDQDWLKIKGADLWTKINQLVVDSAEGAGPKWVRGAGDAEAWTEVPDRKEDAQGRL